MEKSLYAVALVLFVITLGDECWSHRSSSKNIGKLTSEPSRTGLRATIDLAAPIGETLWVAVSVDDDFVAGLFWQCFCSRSFDRLGAGWTGGF